MSTHKDEKNGTWYVMVRYHDWKGVKRQKCKRGFATRREAQEWERNFQLQTDGDPDMTFEAFLELYEHTQSANGQKVPPGFGTPRHRNRVGQEVNR